VLIGFEMASELKVNFYKSCLMGINVSLEFMTMACDFLNCSEGVLPFKYLGLPVGANPSKLATWEPFLEQLTRKLHSWDNKYVSLGGRIHFSMRSLMLSLFFTYHFLKCPRRFGGRLLRFNEIFLREE